MQIDPKIFKEYDIRGTFPDQINRDFAYKLGQALVKHFGVTKIAIGKDARTSGPEIFEGLSEGITSMGVDVVDLGMITTDMAWFSSGKYEFPLTVMISASHNPAEWNGFKIAKIGAQAISLGTGLAEVKALMEKDDFQQASQKGTIISQNVLEDWISHILSFINTDAIKPLRVVVDASNGAGGEQTTKLFEKLKAQLIKLYFEPDGRFPNHLSETTRDENLADVRKKVVEESADIGFMFDGDADRIAVIDEKGGIVNGTVITAIIAKQMLEKHPGETILYNAVVGRVVPELVEKMEGKAIRVRVGHSLIKPKMRELNAIFAGESSYHFFYRDNYFADSGIITLVLLLEALSKDGRKLSEFVEEFTVYPQSGESNYKVEDKEGMMDKVREKFSDAQSIDNLDGLSVWYKDWWFSLRPSNTESLLRLNIEADTQELLEEKKKLMVDLIISLGGKKA